MPDIDVTKLNLPQKILRAAPDGSAAAIDPLKGVIEGCPIVFDKRTAIGDLFYEEIDPHALDDADISDVKFMITTTTVCSRLQGTGAANGRQWKSK